jgi:hypothetical protein
VRSKIFWELLNVASRIQRSKLYRPISDSSLPSTRPSVATTALRASGHRTVTQAGHHVKTIESLELTIKASPKVIQRFKIFNNKRNESVYDVAGAVSEQELKAMMALATELKDITIAWLRQFHPDLLQG